MTDKRHQKHPRMGAFGIIRIYFEYTYNDYIRR